MSQEISTDTVFGAPARWFAEQASGGAPSWLYHFSYVPTAGRGRMPGAAHGIDVPFVFGPGRAFPASDEDLAISRLIRSCWISFARSGWPDCTGVTWPAYTPRDRLTLEFGMQSGLRPDFRATRYQASEAARLPVVGVTQRATD